MCATPPPQETDAASNSKNAEQIARLLILANEALGEDRLTIPKGRSAYDYYQRLVELDAEDPRASEIRHRIVQRYTAMATLRPARRGDMMILRGARSATQPHPSIRERLEFVDMVIRDTPITITEGGGVDSAAPRAIGGTPGLGDYLKALPQHLLPQHTLSGLMFRIARFRLPIWKNALIRWTIRQYRIDMGLAADPNPLSYPHFNAFFTRRLHPEARPFPASPDGIACPADGTLVAFGSIDDNRLLQAKGRGYTLQELLAGSPDRAESFRRGEFATVYLSPRDYHRVHMPLTGRLTEMVYVPGRLFSVNASTARLVPRIFARNERVVAIFQTTLGPMAVILVGAIFVGSMETVWAGQITPPYGQRIMNWHYPETGHESIVLERGAEMGRFNMGSTVILLLPRGAAEWQDQMKVGQSVVVGEELGRAY